MTAGMKISAPGYSKVQSPATKPFFARAQNIIQRTPAPPTVIPRGTNPGDCMGAICQRLNKMRLPGTVAEANTIVDNWVADSISCLHTYAPNSNASHQQEIVQNAEAELQGEAASSKGYITQITPNASGFRDFMEDLRRICERKQREISIEFRYNIVFDNSGLVWGYSPATDWDAIEGAFAGLPAESTWLSPRLLTFRREHVHATNPDVAGETDQKTATITIFDQGFGNLPFSRSKATGIPSTTQTIQHEVGHIMTNLIPRSEFNDFFDNILHWRSYPWAWITASASPYPNWQAERKALITETGMTSAQLDTWLGTLPMNKRINRNNRSFFRGDNFLEAYDMDQVPTIPAFEYAASNKDDYLSELYTFCSSNPEFVHDNLPQKQIVWLKTSVFHTPATAGELSKMYALNEPQQTQFILNASRKFTWEQINDVWQQVMVRNRRAAGQLA